MTHPLEDILEAIRARIQAKAGPKGYAVSRDRDVAFQAHDETAEPSEDLPAIDIRLGPGSEVDGESIGKRSVQSVVFVDFYAEPQEEGISATLLEMYRITYEAVMTDPLNLDLGQLVHRMRPQGHEPVVTNAEGARTVAMMRTAYEVTWRTDLTSATEVT